MGKKLGISAATCLVICLFAAGTATGDATLYNNLPANVVNTDISVGSIPGPGTASGYLNGDSDKWYTGYSFSYTYPSGGITTDEEGNGFPINPADFSGNATYKAESLQAYPYDQPVDTTLYEQAAWLMSQSMSGELNPATAQAAAWQILNKNDAYTSDPNGGSQAYVQALAAPGRGYLNPGDSYTAPTAYGFSSSSSKASVVGGSESRSQCCPVPETSTMFLLGAGFIVLAGSRARTTRSTCVNRDSVTTRSNYKRARKEKEE